MTLTSSYKRDISVKFYFYIIKVTLATFMSTITVVDVAHSEILELLSTEQWTVEIEE